MEIVVRTDDVIRIENGTSSPKIFADVSSNNYQHGFDITFYQMHKLRLIEKDRTFKMFVIPNEFPIEECDFGFWKDGKIVWQSF